MIIFIATLPECGIRQPRLIDDITFHSTTNTLRRSSLAYTDHDQRV